MGLHRAFKLCVALLAAVVAFQPARAMKCSCTCKTGQKPPAPAPASADAPRTYRAILDQHNEYRKKHQAPPLKWNTSLAKSADAWASKCRFEHDTRGGFGENLYSSWGETGRAKVLQSAAKSWYSEAANYDYDSNFFSPWTGHFTQIVWKGTRSIGCSMKACKSNNLVVCRYHPAGNVQGKYDANVKPPRRQPA